MTFRPPVAQAKERFAEIVDLPMSPLPYIVISMEYPSVCSVKVILKSSSTLYAVYHFQRHISKEYQVTGKLVIIFDHKEDIS